MRNTLAIITIRPQHNTLATNYKTEFNNYVHIRYQVSPFLNILENDPEPHTFQTKRYKMSKHLQQIGKQVPFL